MTQVTKTAAQTAKKAANVQVDCFTIGDDGVLTNGINLVGNRLTFGTRSISIDKHHPCHTMGGYMLSTAMFTVTPRFDSKPFLTFVAPSDTNPSALMVMIDLSKSNKPWEEKFTVGAYGTAESIMQSNPMRGLYQFTEGQYLNVLLNNGSVSQIMCTDGKLVQQNLTVASMAATRVLLAEGWYGDNVTDKTFLEGMIDYLDCVIGNVEARDIVRRYLAGCQLSMTQDMRKQVFNMLDGVNDSTAIIFQFRGVSSDATPSNDKKGPPAAYLRKKGQRSDEAKLVRNSMKGTSNGKAAKTK